MHASGVRGELLGMVACPATGAGDLQGGSQPSRHLPPTLTLVLSQGSPIALGAETEVEETLWGHAGVKNEPLCVSPPVP